MQLIEHLSVINTFILDGWIDEQMNEPLRKKKDTNSDVKYNGNRTWHHPVG